MAATDEIKRIQESYAKAYKLDPVATVKAFKGKNLTEITVDGYTFGVDFDEIDNIETLELMEEIEGGKPTKIISFLKNLLGQEGYSNLKAHYVKTEGKMRMGKLETVFEAIFEKYDPKG